VGEESGNGSRGADANPWRSLPAEAPFVLPGDELAIEAFNRRATEDHRVHLELLPEPFFGSQDAPVVVLGLNPGFDPRDEEAHRTPRFEQAMRRNLAHEHGPFPFYYLDPAVADTPGGAWWLRRLRQPIAVAGLDVVASRILCVELFPYHSRRYGRVPPLPSQGYGFHLVAQALRRNALVVAMRSWRLWVKAVPTLAGYPRLVRLRSPQNVAISPRNCGDAWPLVTSALLAAEPGGDRKR
jgi:hypothetical protein